ncbi:enolase C-terminal domain-like protein [Conexibacter arvalis]|uniref:glucarate dehydratase n=1 Tax=Conexibacter arvalis TaxID=912552 RepID=A0A840IFS4_9ACTN|nr:enolase C-terminal domain-like protein [Conexibacter arvalis]MBB4662838.1 glucarate dehydratase [Conexibacter arvalis]
MKSLEIADLRATTVTMPLEAPLRHSNGAHWGRFVRTIVEVETSDGLIGLGELGGGGESARLAVEGLRAQLVGHRAYDLSALWFKLCNPTASLYNNRVQIHAAIEFACLDIVGQALGVPVHDLLGGRLRDDVPFASYLFFRYANEQTGAGEVRTPEQLVAHARELKQQHGFTVHKLKGGVFHPDYELECYQALAEAFPDDDLRFDPNGALDVKQAIRFGQAIEPLRNDYYEDPTWGVSGLEEVRAAVDMRIATNTVVTSMEQLASNVLHRAVDVVLLDTTFWGGIRQTLRAATVCETFQLGVGVHSSGELGVQLATMLHLGTLLPGGAYAADAHYHHLADDVIVGGKMTYRDGAIPVPDGPGLGVRLDRDKLAEYAELYERLGNYPYDRDPGRPGWFALVPNERWADPSADGAVSVQARGGAR